jgi:hypothetical protein
MVIKTNNSTNAYGLYINTSNGTKSDAPSADMANQMEMLRVYFATFDGSKRAASAFQDAFRAAFHPDVTIEVASGNLLDYDTTVEMIQTMCDMGGYADLLDISDNGDGTAMMTINNHIPVEGAPADDVTNQVACFLDGKVIKVRAVEADAKQFDNVVKTFRQCVDDKAKLRPLLNRYVEMISCFDGSVEAYAKAETIIDEIFSRNLATYAKDGSQVFDFDGFKSFASAFARGGDIATIEEASIDANGIRVVIRNIIDGIDQGPCAQIGTVNDGKIVRWSAVPDEASLNSFDILVSSVATKADGMVGNIQRLREYLAALDGKQDAFERFEKHIDRVLAKDIVWCNGDDGSTMNYDEIVASLRDKFIPNGCYPVLESVEDNGDGSLTVVINNHLPGEEGDATRQILYYGDDDLLHKLVSTGLIETFGRVKEL